MNDQNKPDREARNPSELRLASIAAWTAIHKKTPVAAIATIKEAPELYAGYEVLVAGIKSGVVPDVVMQVCAGHTPCNTSCRLLSQVGRAASSGGRAVQNDVCRGM